MPGYKKTTNKKRNALYIKCIKRTVFSKVLFSEWMVGTFCVKFSHKIYVFLPIFKDGGSPKKPKLNAYRQKILTLILLKMQIINSRRTSKALWLQTCKFINKVVIMDRKWARGAMDNASDYGSEDSRFDSWRAQTFDSILLKVKWGALAKHKHGCNVWHFE